MTLARAAVGAFEPLLAKLPGHAALDAVTADDGAGGASPDGRGRGAGGMPTFRRVRASLPGGGAAPDPVAAAAPGGLLGPDALPHDPERAVAIGVIDHAIAFAHSRLATASGTSRVAAAWLQGVPAGAQGPPDIAFGRELTGTAIDALRRGAPGVAGLDDEGIYRRVGMIDLARAGGPGMAAAATHGAAVAGLAAGRDPADPSGRDHPVIAVSVPSFAVADSSGAYLPFYIAIGVIYVVARARRVAAQLRAAGRRTPLPLVINLSFGITAGPHDGSTLLERLLDAVSGGAGSELGPVHVVMPTGNHRLERLHARPAPGEPVEWILPPDDATPSTVEVWGPVERREALEPLNLAVTLPSGAGAVTRFAAPGAAALSVNGREVACAWLRFHAVPGDPARGRQCLTLIAHPTLAAQPGDPVAPAGRWGLRLTTGPAGGDVAVHVQRDDRLPGFGPGARGRQSSLWAPGYAEYDAAGRVVLQDAAPPASAVRRAGAINAYASGARPIRAGGCLGEGVAADRPAAAVARYSALLADGRPGDVLAPSERGPARPGIAVPTVRGGGSVTMTGTSLAAAQVTAWLAACLAGDPSIDGRAAVIARARAEPRPRASSDDVAGP